MYKSGSEERLFLKRMSGNRKGQPSPHPEEIASQTGSSLKSLDLEQQLVLEAPITLQ